MTSKARWIIGLSAGLGLLTLAVWLWPSSTAIPKPNGYLRIQSPEVPPVSLHTLTAPGFPYSMEVHGSSSGKVGRKQVGATSSTLGAAVACN